MSKKQRTAAATLFCENSQQLINSCQLFLQEGIYHIILLLVLLAYCLIVASFVSWSSRTKSSFSKASIVLLLSLVLYFAVFIWVEQIVIKI